MAEERKTKEAENLAALSVEEMFQELNRLLASMEREDATLEESFASYEKGMKLVQLCREKIDGVEKKVKQLSGDGTLEDFE